MLFIYALLALICVVLVIVRNHVWSFTHFRERPAGVRPTGWRLFLRRLFCGFRLYRSHITATPADFGWEYTDCGFYSETGVRLQGWHVAAPERKSSGRLVLILNWLGGCKSDNLKAAEVFLGAGCSVFLLDLRGHGESSGMTTSFGYYEYRDVLAGIEYVRYRFRPESLVLYGVSLGAVACLRAFHAGMVRGVERLVLESPFDRLKNTVRHRAESLHLPGVCAHLFLIACGFVLKYNPYRFNPGEYAAEIGVPVLIFHRRDDCIVTTTEVKEVLSSLPRQSESSLVLADDSGHGSIVQIHPELFRREVEKFLNSGK